jgi:hypothetical protein
MLVLFISACPYLFLEVNGFGVHAATVVVVMFFVSSVKFSVIVLVGRLGALIAGTTSDNNDNILSSMVFILFVRICSCPRF